MLRLTVALALQLVPATAMAASAPKDNAARILRSPNPNDIHPDWRGESTIGTSWTLEPRRTLRVGTGTYLQGDLISPRGGLVTPGVFVLLREWDCA